MHAESQETAPAWLGQIRELVGTSYDFNERSLLTKIKPAVTAIVQSSPDTRLQFVLQALHTLRKADSLVLQLALKAAITAVLRPGLPLSETDAVRLVQAVTERRVVFPFKAILTTLTSVPPTAALHEALLGLRESIDEWHGGTQMRDLHERIDVLLGGAKPEEPSLTAVSGWTAQVFAEIERSPASAAWRSLFLHAKSLTQSTPPRKWQQTAVSLVESIGREEFVGTARRWLALGPMPDAKEKQVPEEEADYQKGFVWTLSAAQAVALCPDIADFAFACFRKIPQIGAVSHRVGNACVNTLAAMPGLDAVSQISRLSMRVKYDVAQRLIEKALAEAAAKNGVTREDLEAMSVPTFGLNADGILLKDLGECQARLEIAAGEALLTWAKDGKALKSVPAGVKAAHADTLSELKKAHKELGEMLTAQRLRLERLLLSPSSCRFDFWKQWYLDHPVNSVLTRRLIWEIHQGGEVQTAAWWQDRLVSWTGEAVIPADDAVVRLWHPIRADVQTVLSWRCWLEDREVVQPFKQAHREVYLLTDAERQTDRYSNRFASHVIKQHQFAALCRERGWQFRLMGAWDSFNTPYLELPQHQLRAEFQVEFPRTEETSAHMIYLVIGTDRVQFFSTAEKATEMLRRPTPVRLEEVPAAVFSEVMRDADLFVSVTSIGVDPLWRSEHPEDPNNDYWADYAFGELSESAQNRRSVLEKLIPKLAIRDHCHFDGRYLCVKGQKNEYRIHMGSGNVIMEPGSRYLCIVHGAGDSAARLALPFEGDRILSLILSKAFLLVNDVAIKDESIRRQLD